jgi:predicted Na+-dependent transporter
MTDQPTLAGLLSPKARAWVYAILSILVPLATLLIALLSDGWQWTDLALVLASLVPSAGFQLARSNTPAPEPPPAI